MHVLYVDDELPALLKFELLAQQIPDITSFKTCSDPREALVYARGTPIDTAFLDVEMPGMNGMELARALKALNRNVRIVFVTAYDQYALEAFRADALDYLLKPYSREKLERAIQKAALMRNAPNRHVFIKTFGGFDVFVDGELMPIASPKPKELLALLVDKRGGSVTPGMAIACLWEDRESNDSTGALYRMTGKRLRELLQNADIAFLLASGSYRAVNPDAFSCDYYDFLAGSPQAREKYGGDYLPEYSWAEDTNAQLSRIMYGDA